MTGRPLVVVVIGSECTGKTTMARTLAARYGATLSAEYAREYVDAKRAPLDAADVEPIAAGQRDGEDAAAAAAGELVVKDTDLVSTTVYARHYYGTCPGWVDDAARARLGDLYLLLHPDVPWVADGLQRDRPVGRDRIHELFRAALAARGAHTVDITGPWQERLATAEAAVSACLTRGRREAR
jgi:NadR type nicotinamide-nucleotide adenylyltransferase